MPSELIKNAQVLFGVKGIPVPENIGDFSLSWAGAQPGESVFKGLTHMIEARDLYEMKAGMNKIKKWRSMPVNMVMADRFGNIGYALMSASPNRGEHEYPYLSCRVLDGSTSRYDWLHD